MLSTKLLDKLESIRDLPTVPVVVSTVLDSVDNINISAKKLAQIIEKDQSLTAKVLSVANSPFYGFARKISTIDLAVVLMGLNTIKEILISITLKKFFAKGNRDRLDINNFWRYSVFCGSCSRLLARELGYKLAGEAFVAGLIHDIGIMIEAQFFPKEFLEIKRLTKEENYSFIKAERTVLDCTHAEIGHWFAIKWNLPEKICRAIYNHHTPFNNSDEKSIKITDLYTVDEPLTMLVAMTEWFAGELGFMQWNPEVIRSPLYLANEILEDIKYDEMMSEESSLNLLKIELINEYQKAAGIINI